MDQKRTFITIKNEIDEMNQIFKFERNVHIWLLILIISTLLVGDWVNTTYRESSGLPYSVFVISKYMGFICFVIGCFNLWTVKLLTATFFVHVLHQMKLLNKFVENISHMHELNVDEQQRKLKERFVLCVKQDVNIVR